MCSIEETEIVALLRCYAVTLHSWLSYSCTFNIVTHTSCESQAALGVSASDFLPGHYVEEKLRESEKNTEDDKTYTLKSTTMLGN